MEPELPYREFKSSEKIKSFMTRRGCKGKYRYATRNSKKITEAIQKTRKYAINAQLMYASLNYHCSLGGPHIEKLKGAERQRNRV